MSCTIQAQYSVIVKVFQAIILSKLDIDFHIPDINLININMKFLQLASCGFLIEIHFISSKKTRGKS